MPFYVLPYHIGVRKGMEGHWDVHQRTLYYLYYIITLKGIPFQTLLDIVMSGRAWPSLLSSYHEGVRKGKEGHLVVVWRRAFGYFRRVLWNGILGKYFFKLLKGHFLSMHFKSPLPLTTSPKALKSSTSLITFAIITITKWGWCWGNDVVEKLTWNTTSGC